jgi:hypothetical protein
MKEWIGLFGVWCKMAAASMAVIACFKHIPEATHFVACATLTFLCGCEIARQTEK